MAMVCHDTLRFTFIHVNIISTVRVMSVCLKQHENKAFLDTRTISECSNVIT